MAADENVHFDEESAHASDAGHDEPVEEASVEYAEAAPEEEAKSDRSHVVL